ncbi:MAG TPA: ATP-dependent DNA helicase RecG [Candidatus Paceibacterota bacterium]|nr:ATP-dependent DNA helicase RecG [Candidatus Paceibacterota bacterium]HQM34964.1 ATP-dependent DNA helicase RecG [Candidatus Paceibacterota bacterium]
MFDFQTPIQLIPGVGPAYLKRFYKLGIKTVGDLLFYFPFRYEDFSQIKKISQLTPDEVATIVGKILQIKTFRTWHKKMFITEAVIEDETGTLKVIWFNQPFLMKNLKTNDWISIAGRLSKEKNGTYFIPSHYEKIYQQDFSNRRETAGLIPVYSETAGLSSRALRFFIKKCLNQTRFPIDPLPLFLRQKYHLLDLKTALHQIHFPTSLINAEAAKKRFHFENLFILELIVTKQRLQLKQYRGFYIKSNMEALKKFTDKLNFQLTQNQKNAILDILKDLQKDKPMNRLLQGDVGSGKTIVAAIAALMTVKNNYQVAFMAPTEILAEQHFRTFTQLFKDFDITIGLITSATTQISWNGLVSILTKKDFLKQCAQQQIQIIIGTHALIQKNVRFPHLGLAIIDEQHRFGVEQRKKLLENKNNFIPHLLSMTATPIPRTLALTLWGDLDISSIKELPKNRKPIITKIITPPQREKVYQFIRSQVQAGRQVFVICPLINNSLQLEVKSVTQEYEKLKKEVFPDLSIAMLHGKMKTETKDSIMKKFLNQEIDILISTSVIEVGIDVPNATVMMIEGAERFGLAQLYQFRGRVGRGNHQSYCFLFTETSNANSHKRLEAILKAKNSFELAELDLQMRGPGEFLGKRQSGLPDYFMEALKNLNLIEITKKEAENLLNTDPTLNKYPLLKEKIEQQLSILEMLH